MVVFRKGADPVALDASASRLEAFARECRSVRIASEEVVGRLGAAWAGRDLERLRGDWQRAAPGMDLVEKTLVALGARLRENAARQRGTSGASGGSATSAPTTGGPQDGVGVTPSEGRGGLSAGSGSTAPAMTMAFGTPSPQPGPSPTPPLAPPATTGTGGPVNGYEFGAPDKPDITWDEGFVYNSKDSTWRDHISKAEWMAKLEGGRVVRPDLDDATAMYEHYWDNNGEPARFDYEEGLREDEAVRANVNAEIATTAAAVDQMARNGNSTFSVTGPAHLAPNYPTTENWQKTIGGYQQWSSADVRVEDGQVTMTITVHAEDYYNFNPSQHDIATGAGDDENGRFTEIGWAKPFPSSGDVTRTISWPVGSPPPTVDIGTGEMERTPGLGREDRADGRGSER